MSRGARALAGALLAAALAPAPAPGSPPSPAAGDEVWNGWREEITRARSELELARERRDAAEAAVTRMRHRRQPRGRARKALFAERDEARAACAEAEQALELALEEARRAGLPQGYLDATRWPTPAAASE